MELKHFSHDHPLMLKEIEKKNKNDRLVVCFGCGDPVLGPSYSCNQCSHFTLHKSCAELPPEMHHPSHRQHPLSLIAKAGYRCDVCLKSHYLNAHRFRYRCSQCDFDLDLKCASNWRIIIQSDCHDHNFTVFRKRQMSLLCDACGGTEGNDTFYLCTICQLLVHLECTSLPRHIQTTGHEHPLVLTWFLKSIDIDRPNQMCKVCYKPMGENQADYCCQRCSYIAHYRCAIKNIEDDGQDETTAPGKEISSSMESAHAQQFNHFSHQHLLVLTTDQNEVVKDEDRINTCEACIRPITATEVFYRCTQECRFFLHKTCAQLPTKRHHPVLHLHQLTLIPRAPTIGNVFMCGLCETLCQGFAYYCDKCDFFYDLQCSMLPDSLTHEAHELPLFFNYSTSKYNIDPCKGCGVDTKYGFRFSCTAEYNIFGRQNRRRACFECPSDSKFHLCVSCAKLPLTARHKYDIHPLKLTYHTVENELREYYCEICEGTRNPKHWFYYCKDCDFDCHPKCVLGRYQVKLGSTYKHDAHRHPVTLVDKRDNILSCEVCGKPCEGLVFQCSQCNINMHRECMCL